MSNVARFVVVVMGLVVVLGVSGVGAGADTNTYTFSYTGIKDSKVEFSGVEGCKWTHVAYGCGGDSCRFFVNETGVAGATFVKKSEMSGSVVVSQARAGAVLSFTCKAAECRFRSEDARAGKKDVTLQTEKTFEAPESAQIVVTVRK